MVNLLFIVIKFDNLDLLVVNLEVVNFFKVCEKLIENKENFINKNEEFILIKFGKNEFERDLMGSEISVSLFFGLYVSKLYNFFFIF